ncbi:hypothetical protein Lesp01_01860 [Lentzea sp. NBRC 102530]|nr:hypothetical protein Lesp01_01860 [Lentzea sp. NBRC 102530]
MVVGAVDQGDLDVRALEAADHAQPAEPTSDNDDAVLVHAPRIPARGEDYPDAGRDVPESHPCGKPRLAGRARVAHPRKATTGRTCPSRTPAESHDWPDVRGPHTRACSG